MITRINKNIQSCLKNDCHFGALALALTLPDICGETEYPTINSSSQRYILWYNEYIGKYELDRSRSLGDNPLELPYLSGELVYQLRCSFLHSGNIDFKEKKIHDEQNQHLEFILELRSHTDILATSTSTSVEIGKNGDIEQRSYTVGVAYLCKLLANASMDYYEKNKDKFHFNYKIIDRCNEQQ